MFHMLGGTIKKGARRSPTYSKCEKTCKIISISLIHLRKHIYCIFYSLVTLHLVVMILVVGLYLYMFPNGPFVLEEIADVENCKDTW